MRNRQGLGHAYPDLKAWQRRTGGQAKRENRIVTPGGRIRDFSTEKRGYKFTEALNTPIQGAEAEILLNTLALLPRRINGYDIQLVNTIHDELVFEVAKGEGIRAKEIVETTMIDGFLASFPDAGDMTAGLVEAQTGNNWADAK